MHICSIMVMFATKKGGECALFALYAKGQEGTAYFRHRLIERKLLKTFEPCSKSPDQMHSYLKPKTKSYNDFSITVYHTTILLFDLKTHLKTSSNFFYSI